MEAGVDNAMRLLFLANQAHQLAQGKGRHQATFSQYVLVHTTVAFVAHGGFLLFMSPPHFVIHWEL